jgi:protein TonB
VLEPLNIDLIPQGDYMIDAVAIQGAAAAEVAEQHQTRQPQPQPEPTDAPEADKTTPSPPVASVTPPEIAPDPRVKEAELQVLEQQREIRLKKLRAARIRAQREAEAEERREERAEERRREIRGAARRRLMAHRDEVRNSRSSNQGGSEGHRAGVAIGQATRGARANYGAIVSAELNRHKFYPPGARARGETGSVGVSFSVGGSGRIVGHSIYSSSGSSALDGAVHQMMASAHAPPPPGGSFHGSILIRFDLGR